MKNYYRSKKYFLFFIGLGLASWAISLIFSGATRNPAAVQSENFFSFFNREASLETALHKDIVGSIQVAKLEKSFQINVRNFLVKNLNNMHLCEYYDSYTLTFEAEGIASSGQRPTMIVTSPCRVSAKTKLPIPVIVPVEDIFKLRPTDTDISFEINPSATFSFRNVMDVWPSHWVLSKIKFEHSEFSDRQVFIDRKKIYTYSVSPAVMEWEN